MKAKLACFLLLVTMAFGLATAQDRGLTVSGVVTDPQGEPVPGVVVQIQGTTQGVTADVSGHYSINVPAGTSTLIFTCMGYQTSALQATRKSEIAAYFYSYPQRYALGFETPGDFDRWKASMSAMFTIGRDADGNMPQVGQFPQQSMVPYYDHLKMFAGLFAGETGMTLEDMGLPAPSFSASFCNVAYTAVCLRDNLPYERDVIKNIKPIWEPIFEPDASQYGAIGDAIFKINTASEGYIGRNTIYDMTGIAPEGGDNGGDGGRSSGALAGYFQNIPDGDADGQNTGAPDETD